MARSVSGLRGRPPRGTASAFDAGAGRGAIEPPERPRKYYATQSVALNGTRCRGITAGSGFWDPGSSAPRGRGARAARRRCRELSDLPGGQRVDDVPAHGLDMARSGRADHRPAMARQPGVGGAAVLGAGEPLDQPPLLQASYDVGEPRQGCVGPLASAVIRSVRSGASESIASTKYSKWVRPASRRSWESSTPAAARGPRPAAPMPRARSSSSHRVLMVRALAD